ncbi:MAG: ATP-binding cassette domain-containing protein, partial [Candidatus Saccharimonadales bacterium]
YYNIEDRVKQSLDAYQLSGAAGAAMKNLSGGQKRFVELVRVEHSAADLALIDEPTNHMDYVAKAMFLKWFANVKHAVVVITHDRDLLQKVTRIIEIKDAAAYNFAGNYTAYLKQNANITANNLNEYDTLQRRIINIKKQINSARAKKASTSKTPNPFVVIENRLVKELAELEIIERPSFWIDQESVAGLRPKIEASYQKHKAKTIHIKRFSAVERQRELLKLDKVQVGYQKPLFDPLSLAVASGERYRLIGRNGAGKTTLVNTILSGSDKQRPATWLGGDIIKDLKLRINNYDQEIDEALLDLKLGQAIEKVYSLYDVPCNDEKIMRTLSDYLFDPYMDREQLVGNLSGGQKARLQLIKLFANDPNLLIVDEPTNHLDLPSIEELEAALAQYRGALIYISHDSYLANHLGGSEISLGQKSSLVQPG